MFGSGSGIWNMLSNNLDVSDYNMYMYLSMISCLLQQTTINDEWAKDIWQKFKSKGK